MPRKTDFHTDCQHSQCPSPLPLHERHASARATPRRAAPRDADPQVFHNPERQWPPSGESEVAIVVPVEAQGIEPWSELASSTASTCVDNCLYRRPCPASCQPCPSLSPECLTHRPGARRWASPDFRTESVAPGGLRSSVVRQASVLLSLRGQRQFSVGVCVFPHFFTRITDLGTLRYFLPTRRSRSPPGMPKHNTIPG